MDDRFLTADELLTILGRDRVMALAAPDRAQQVIVQAKSQAEGLAQSYLLGRYGNQLPSTPETAPQVLKEQVAELAIYRIASLSHDVVAPELKDRYDAATRWHQRVASGQVDLGLPNQPDVDLSTPRMLANKSRRDMVFGNGGLKGW